MFGIDFTGIPLHPLVVHFPVVLAVLLPVAALASLWAIRKGATARRAWTVTVALAAALSLSAYVATQTGEREEDRVEQVVGDSAMHGHEEAGERFLVLSGVLFLVSLAGLLAGVPGQAGRWVTLGGALAVLAVGVQVGHSGGELVYKHGAASAYAEQTVMAPSPDRDVH